MPNLPKPYMITRITAILNMPNAPTGNLSDVFDLFYEQVKDFPAEVFDAALKQYLTEETFFPSPGAIRRKAVDLQLLAMGIPTANEAWGEVLSAYKYTQPARCDEGERLDNLAARANEIGQSGVYFATLRLIDEHLVTCHRCTRGGYAEVYSHPVVAEVVKQLGGRDALLTDNPASDRKQFVDAYRERLQIEIRKIGMTPDVADYVREQALLMDDRRAAIEQERRAALDTGERQIAALTNRLTRK